MKAVRNKRVASVFVDLRNAPCLRVQLDKFTRANAQICTSSSYIIMPLSIDVFAAVQES